MRFRINMAKYGTYEGRLGREFKPTVAKALRAAAGDAISKLRYATINAPPASANGARGAVATGDYRDGWHFRPEPADPLTVHVGNQKHYARFIELGRAPGKPPPVSVIENWVEDRLGIIGNETRSVAFLIARAIGRRGLRARHVMGGVQGAIMAKAKYRVLRALERAMDKAKVR